MKIFGRDPIEKLSLATFETGAALREGLDKRGQEYTQVEPFAEGDRVLRWLPTRSVAVAICVGILVATALSIAYGVINKAWVAASEKQLASGMASTREGKEAEADVFIAPPGTSLARAGSGESGPEVGADRSDTGAQGMGGDEELKVHVVGAVGHPGVVLLSGGARIDDAIEAAGGALPQAQLGAINLAQVLQDGDQIVVPTLDQMPQIGCQAGQCVAGAGGVAQGVNASEGRGEGAVTSAVSLNNASLVQLQELPGIGPALAQRIIDYRQANGGFKTIEQLDEVSGIGPALMGRLKDKVRL
ncbi:MAG: helix-hairpin-helix domain-containing protein [Actinomycetaceae bacterium]|nr:helix-hairpin-helix domain-containing protein [Actinomycetaceae bacterium]